MYYANAHIFFKYLRVRMFCLYMKKIIQRKKMFVVRKNVKPSCEFLQNSSIKKEIKYFYVPRNRRKTKENHRNQRKNSRK
jgi:hypothetical protein